MIDLVFSQLGALVFATAVIFTVFGWYVGARNNTEHLVVFTIDSLIKDGYLKTRGTGEDLEILKWNEWNE